MAKPAACIHQLSGFGACELRSGEDSLAWASVRASAARLSTKAGLSTSAVTLRPSRHGQAVEPFAPDVDELQQIKGHLHDLARGKPTAKRRNEVEALLRNKWEGVQVSAAHVLADWGGPESISALRAWLSEGGANWTVRREAVKALGQCVGEDDVGWALDFYFDNARSGLWLWPLVIGLPRRPTLTRLRREAEEDSPNREAAEVALRWISQQEQWLGEHSGSEGQMRR